MLLTLLPGAQIYAQTTEDGEDAHQPETEVVEEEFVPDAVVDTGDAAAVTDIVETDNYNKVDTEGSLDEENTEDEGETPAEEEETDEPSPLAENNETELESDTSTTTPSELDDLSASNTPSTDPTATTTPTLLDPLLNGTSTPSELSDSPLASSTATGTAIALDNQATSTTNATTSANTGHNLATGEGPSAVITGDAYAYANVVNLTNTNIINSNGFIAFLNQLFGQGNVDLRDMFDVFEGSTSTSPCNSDGCEAGQLENYISNNANINNNVNVTADTGHNNASGSESVILTGDAYAAANVTNFANTNIIDANYLMLSFSNFGDLFGDIVLPAKHLLEKFFLDTTGYSIPQTIDIDNNAEITNNVSTGANTGNNTASTTSEGGTILTGNSTSYSNVYNQINTNSVNSDSFVMLFRVSGDWNGQVYGLPDGLSWEQTPEGIAISNTNIGGQSTPPFRGITADIQNDATITNNVSATANTGYNHASGEGMTYIETGDAYAATNVTNVANTNIIGRNWSLLIFDIFGDWNGDISFGQPDLWIGGTANATDGTTAAGAEVLYTFTISNLGDTDAPNVMLNGDMSSDLIQLTDPMQDISLGTVSPGETIEMTFPAKVVDSLPEGSFPVNLAARLSSSRPEGNMSNNEEVVTVIAENHSRSRSGGGSGFKVSDVTRFAEVEVEKTASQEFISPGDTVEYEVSITNTGGPVFGGILYDTLYDSNNEIILDQSWPLDTIGENETITVTYEIEFSSDSSPGVYTNSAQILGYHKNKIERYMREYDSNIAEVPITIVGTSPLVLGAVTSSDICEPYLTTYLRAGYQNNFDETTRLQNFINDFTDQNIPVSGWFDSSTEQAVRTFQTEHKASILEPWGLTSPTGYVYYTTRKLINEIYCDHARSFPLTITQNSEISRYRFASTVTSEPVIKPSAPGKPTTEVPVATPAVIQQTPKKILLPVSNEVPNPNTINNPNRTSTSAIRDVSPVQQNIFRNVTNWFRNISISQLKIW